MESINMLHIKKKNRRGRDRPRLVPNRRLIGLNIRQLRPIETTRPVIIQSPMSGRTVRRQVPVGAIVPSALILNSELRLR